MLEKAVTKLLQFYISESIPEYIVDSARHAFSNESNKKMTIDTGDPIWTVEFPIQDEDFQLYTPKLMINHASGHIESSCNCENSFAGACTHVAATALAMLKHMEESLAASEHTPQPIRSTWKQTFRSFFSSDIDPEVGKYYLVYRIYLHHLPQNWQHKGYRQYHKQVLGVWLIHELMERVLIEKYTG